MDEKCGELFEAATSANDSLIDFEFGFNNFSLNDVNIKLIIQSLYRLKRYKITLEGTRRNTMRRD
jgi:hypothetical protein